MHHYLRQFAHALIVISLPIFLLILNVRLVMSHAYVNFEYSQPGFPRAELVNDTERYRLATASVDFVRGEMPVEAYRALRLGNRPAFNEREIKHMVDVQVVTRRVFGLHWFSAGLIALGLLILARQSDARVRIARSLFSGSVLTIVLLGAIGLGAALSFDWFFVKFHQVFFEGNSWLFPETDTLIQLFPEPFWYAAAIILAGGTIGEALILGIVARRMGRQPESSMTETQRAQTHKH